MFTPAERTVNNPSQRLSKKMKNHNFIILYMILVKFDVLETKSNKSSKKITEILK